MTRWATHVSLVRPEAGECGRIGITVRQRQGGDMEAYCVKCKAKKEIKDPQKVKMKNGRPAMKGRCPDCGTGLYRILKP